MQKDLHMKYEKLFAILQERIKFTPKVADIAKILGISNKTLYARAQRDSDFSDEEVEKIEAFYGIDLMGASANCVELDYIHIQPSCGYGTPVQGEAEVTPIRIGKELIKEIWKSEPQNLKLFKASGDSMEPVISNNDVLLVDIASTDFNNGGIFLLTINNEWFVKRLRLRITGELDIISENEKYPVETLQPNSNIEICIKGRVIKNFSRGL